MGRRMRTAVLGAACVLSAAAAWAAPEAKVVNPAGGEASDIVVQVMKTYGIEQGEVAFIDSGAWAFASETSAVVAMETSLRTDAVLEFGETAAYGNIILRKGVTPC